MITSRSMRNPQIYRIPCISLNIPGKNVAYRLGLVLFVYVLPALR